MLFQTPHLTEAETDVLRRIDRLRQSLRHQLPERRWMGLLRRMTLARAIQGSNSIEGYNVSLDDAVAAVAGEEPLDAASEAWLAVTGYRDAMTYVLQLSDDPDFAYDEALLRSLHYMMLKYALDKSPGRWRPGVIHVQDERTGDIVYTGPDAAEVPPLMAEFVAGLRHEDDQTHPIVRAAMAHLNLVMIHPFRDGNGRMARCAQTLVLAREGFAAPIFSSIEEYLGRNTEAYYEILADVGRGAWQPYRDARPWLRFVLTAHHIQAQTHVYRAEEAERRWSRLTIVCDELRLPERSISALFNTSMGFRLTNANYRELAEITESAAGRDLKLLTAAGLLAPVGERRGRYYVGSPRLRELNESVRARPRQVQDPFAVIEQTLGL